MERFRFSLFISFNSFVIVLLLSNLLIAQAILKNDFKIKSGNLITETEDNGTLALANSVAIGDTISGVIETSSDVDY